MSDVCGHGDPCPCNLDMTHVEQERDSLLQEIWRLKDALYGCVNQFAYERVLEGSPAIGNRRPDTIVCSAGGYSAMDAAFAVLNLPEQFIKRELWNKWEADRQRYSAFQPRSTTQKDTAA